MNEHEARQSVADAGRLLLSEKAGGTHVGQHQLPHWRNIVRDYSQRPRLRGHADGGHCAV